MAKIEITKTELVWPGKYNEDGTLKEVPRVSLPFQVIERVNESRATREANKGRRADALRRVRGQGGRHLRGGLAEQAHLGRQPAGDGVAPGEVRGEDRPHLHRSAVCDGSGFFVYYPRIGESGEEVTKEQSVIEEKAYDRTGEIRGAKTEATSSPTSSAAPAPRSPSPRSSAGAGSAATWAAGRLLLRLRHHTSPASGFTAWASRTASPSRC
jgi:hypothetical protein